MQQSQSNDVKTASPLDPKIEEEREILGLRLMRDVVRTAELSSNIRETVAQSVATRVSRG